MPQAVIAIGSWVLGAVGATGLAAAAGTAAFLVGAAVVIGTHYKAVGTSGKQA